jgi:thiol-disulfide isomerase/thioredoxin
VFPFPEAQVLYIGAVRTDDTVVLAQLHSVPSASAPDRWQGRMFVILSLLIGLACLYGSQHATAGSLEPLLRAAGLSHSIKPVPAADFQLSDATGRLLQLQKQRGKVVFLNFWAIWCPPCRHEMPMLEQVYQALREQPFVLWAVNFQEGQEEVSRFMRDQRLHFPALLDLDGSVSRRYKVQGLPMTYIVDCAGMIVGQAVGPRPWHNDATRTLLAALLHDARCHRPTPASATPHAEKDP